MLRFGVRDTKCSCHPQCEGVDWNHIGCVDDTVRPMSPSVWGCGLKCHRPKRMRLPYRVTLSVRVWIEILQPCQYVLEDEGHPQCEGVDWNSFLTIAIELFCGVTLSVRVWIEMPRWEGWLWHSLCHPQCEGVDWNGTDRIEAATIIVTLSVRVWIEINKPLLGKSLKYCHPQCEGVDWNADAKYDDGTPVASPSVWGCGLKFSHNRLTAFLAAGHPQCEGVDWNICGAKLKS